MWNLDTLYTKGGWERSSDASSGSITCFRSHQPSNIDYLKQPIWDFSNFIVWISLNAKQLSLTRNIFLCKSIQIIIWVLHFLNYTLIMGTKITRHEWFYPEIASTYLQWLSVDSDINFKPQRTCSFQSTQAVGLPGIFWWNTRDHVKESDLEALSSLCNREGLQMYFRCTYIC